jgi:NDP-sugar pyrophosphorylase family protein
MSLASVDAVVLCGGLGTRLKPVLPDGQKTMAEISGRPFLQIVVDWLRAEGLRRLVFCAGHRADEVERFFAGRYPDMELAFSVEREPLGTAGALKNCAGLIRASTTLLVNGDSLCALRLQPFLDFHRDRGGAASLVAVAPGDRRDGGYLRVEAAGRVASFGEKSFFEGARLNAGVYCLEREALDGIPAGRPCSLERETLPALIARGVYAYDSETPLFDIGTPERLRQFREAYSAGFAESP